MSHVCDVCNKGVESPYHFSSRSDRHVHICETCFKDNQLDRCLVDLGRLKDPAMDGGLKLRLRGIYVRKDNTLTGPLQVGSSVEFPYKDPSNGAEYTPQGMFWLGLESNLDLVREYKPE